jgi:predicted enzyme related to lactoylglutathione lyase
MRLLRTFEEKLSSLGKYKKKKFMNEKMSAETNALNWFEIPASDISRAKKFYENIFEIKMEEMEMPNMKYAIFPFDPLKGKVAGGLAQGPMHTPGATGSIIYLNANPDLQKVLDRIEKVGGKITMPKTSIGQNGFMAFFTDSEGNTVALHSNT